MGQKFLQVAILALLASPVSAGECTAEDLLGTAQWAYDSENRILRLCIETPDGARLRCTAFPQEVALDPFSIAR